MKLDPSLITAATATAETIVNRALALDPMAQAKIEVLEDTVIKLLLTPLTIAITVQAQNGRLIVSGIDDKFTPADIDVTLEGSPLALSRLVLEQDKDRLIRSGDIRLTGNAEKALQFQALLADLELDWESALAEIIGDIPAHFIGQRLRSGLQWGKQTHQSLLANIEEYLHEESRALPTTSELQAHFSAIDDLRLATERLDARLARLKALTLEQEHASPEPDQKSSN